MVFSHLLALILAFARAGPAPWRVFMPVLPVQVLAFLQGEPQTSPPLRRLPRLPPRDNPDR